VVLLALLTRRKLLQQIPRTTGEVPIDAGIFPLKPRLVNETACQRSPAAEVKSAVRRAAGR